MDLTSALSLCAIVISVVALSLSTLIAVRQLKLLKRQNSIPAFVQLLAEFRKPELHRHFATVSGLDDDDRSLPLSRLSEEKRSAIIDVSYLLQTFCGLMLAGVVDEKKVMPLVRGRIVNVWEKIAPIVQKERELIGFRGSQFLFLLEYYALVESERSSPEQSIKDALGPKRAARLEELRARRSEV